jgi:hypothetical protein
MTVVAVRLDPPRDGLVLPDLPDTSPLAAAAAPRLYEAMAMDAMLAAAESGGDLLVNYRGEDSLPAEFAREDGTAESQARTLVEDALEEDAVADARVEVQVGSSRSARVGNTITHLLESEGANSAAVLEPDAPLFLRKDVDSAAMKLRRSEVVLGPAQDGDLYFAGFTEPVDFENAFAAPALENVNARAIDAGHDVDFVGTTRRLQTGADLRSLVSELRARRAAGRLVPPHTTAFVEELGLWVDATEDGTELVRE